MARNQYRSKADRASMERLTALTATGATFEEISAALNLSTRTVARHIKDNPRWLAAVSVGMAQRQHIMEGV